MYIMRSTNVVRSMLLTFCVTYLEGVAPSALASVHSKVTMQRIPASKTKGPCQSQSSQLSRWLFFIRFTNCDKQPCLDKEVITLFLGHTSCQLSRGCSALYAGRSSLKAI